MKILIVTPYFYPHPGGVESYTLNIARQLKALGWTVVVVTTSTEHLGTVVEDFEGMKIYYLHVKRVVSNTPVNRAWRRELKTIFAAEKPDVINAHAPVPYLADVAERVRGAVPFVLTYHGDLIKDTWPYKPIVALLNRLVISRTLRRSDHIIATSTYYADKSPFLRVHKAKISIVPPGVDVQQFNPAVPVGQLRRRYRGQRLILYVGSLSKTQRHKGIDVLIDAFGRLHKRWPNTKLVAIGAGDAIAEYQARAEAAGVGGQVEFPGRLDHDQLAQYYRLASVFAMASRDDNESFGMVYMEASATGTPVIGTTVGGVPYAVQGGKTGLLVKPGSVADLQKALETILGDPELARRLGEAGAKRAAEEFAWPLLGCRTAAILAKAAKPSIVQVAGYYPPHMGGMERVVQAISEQLAGRGYDVRVLTSAVDAAPSTTEPVPGLRLTRFKAREFAHTPFALGFVPAIFGVPRRRTIIHLHLAQAFYPELVLLAARLRRIPYVLHFHLDLQPSGPLGVLFKVYKAVVLRLVIRQADSVVVFSEDQRAFIHNRYGVARAKISVIPNGVGTEYFVPPRRYSKAANKLLYVGRLAPQKRLSLLLDAMALLPKKIRLTIVGDGEERVRLEREARELGLTNVRFVGPKTPAETLDYYREADLFVLTSEREGMPLVLLEAMASALPVVGTDVTGITEVVKGVGVLVGKADGRKFADALSTVLDDPDRLRQLSEQSRRAAGRYSWDRLADSFEKLYEQLTA